MSSSSLFSSISLKNSVYVRYLEQLDEAYLQEEKKAELVQFANDALRSAVQPHQEALTAEQPHQEAPTAEQPHQEVPMAEQPHQDAPLAEQLHQDAPLVEQPHQQTQVVVQPRQQAAGRTRT
ncbi:hypothetical protein OROMI_028331 [Orobanche minor]